MALIERLKPYEDLDMIGIFSERFSLDPDTVYNKTSFNTVAGFMSMWKEKGEYGDRYAEAEKESQQEPKPPSHGR